MEKKWYIVQIIAGYEEKVKAEILKRIQERGLEEQFGEILIPQVKTTNNFYNSNTNTNSLEQLFPGYILVSLFPDVSNFRLITTVNRVIRFLGGESPLELSQGDVDRVLSQISGKVTIATASNIIFTVGDHIEIINGPFSGFSGFVNSVDDQKQKLVVMISIFNRLTPIEILFNQAKK